MKAYIASLCEGKRASKPTINRSRASNANRRLLLARIYTGNYSFPCFNWIAALVNCAVSFFSFTRQCLHSCSFCQL